MPSVKRNLTNRGELLVVNGLRPCEILTVRNQRNAQARDDHGHMQVFP